jgi:hypothetical protein
MSSFTGVVTCVTDLYWVSEEALDLVELKEMDKRHRKNFSSWPGGIVLRGCFSTEDLLSRQACTSP